MKTTRIAKSAFGFGAALLGLTAIPATAAYGSDNPFPYGPSSIVPQGTVPCSGPHGGAAGLIAAINAANNGGPGTINLAQGCTYTLDAVNSTTSNTMIGGANGLPAVLSPITIIGHDATITGSPASTTTPFRIFEVDSGGNLTLDEDVTITGGNSTAGGGILNLGTVTLDNSDVTGNTATTLGGGGIASLGTLVLNASQVSDNTAPTPPPSPGVSEGLGGGILSGGGSVSLNYSQVTGNTAAGGGGGIVSATMGMSRATSTLTLDNSQVNENTAATGPGGGIACESSTVVLTSSEVKGNNTSTGGGGVANVGGVLTLNFSQVDNNTSTGGGGGIANGNGNGGGTPPLGTLNLFSSEVDGNTSTGGPMDGAGGIANGGIATITLSQVDNNSAPGAAGGGILNHGTMTINRSQVDDNSAPGLGGGGIANLDFAAAPITSSGSTPNTPSGVLTVNFSQVDNNSAAGGMGGGIFEAGVTATFTFTLAGGPLALNGTQVTGNISAAGGGIYATTGSQVTLNGTLIFGNNPHNCEPLGTITGCFG